MRRAASAAAAAVLLAGLAGCGGGPDPAVGRTLDAFFTQTARGRAWGRVFPHRPGSLPCTVHDPVADRTVPATCSIEFALVEPRRAVVTLTEAWNRGARARTWFVFIHRDGTIESILHERALPPAPATTTATTTS
ncbi:MAG TPA: hypothetical protein VJ986_05090 [Gaiellaceae bacterium]|nr:hypothetical protein [Gaiellaceae bacterium]